MIKLASYDITFREVPELISLTLSLSRCPYRCEGCHSPWLRDDVGVEFTRGVLTDLMSTYGDHIDCICILGDGDDKPLLIQMIEHIKEAYPNHEVCLYSGADRPDSLLLRLVDYYKIGPYRKELGGLEERSTNQRMYYRGEDITHKFWTN